MANIVLVTVDTSHRAVTYNKTILQNFGHTVTTMLDSAITSASVFDAYDLIVTVRRTAYSPTESDYIRAAIDAGKPAIVGVIDQGIQVGPTYSSSTIGFLEIAGASAMEDLIKAVYILDVDHPILAGITGLPRSVDVYSATTAYIGYDSEAESSGTSLGLLTFATTENVTMTAIEVGDLDVSAIPNPFGARVVMLGWLYSLGSVTYTADALTMLENSINWALGIETGGPTLYDVNTTLAAASTLASATASRNTVATALASVASMNAHASTAQSVASDLNAISNILETSIYEKRAISTSLDAISSLNANASSKMAVSSEMEVWSYLDSELAEKQSIVSAMISSSELTTDISAKYAVNTELSAISEMQTSVSEFDDMRTYLTVTSDLNAVSAMTANVSEKTAASTTLSTNSLFTSSVCEKGTVSSGMEVLSILDSNITEKVYVSSRLNSVSGLVTNIAFKSSVNTALNAVSSFYADISILGEQHDIIVINSISIGGVIGIEEISIEGVISADIGIGPQ